MKKNGMKEECSECFKPYCNGQIHRQTFLYIYPACNDCGIELLDIRELMENADDNNSTGECTVCQKKNLANFSEHFLQHFYANVEQRELKMYCIECSYRPADDSQKIIENEKFAIQCEFCMYICYQYSELKQHYLKTHNATFGTDFVVCFENINKIETLPEAYVNSYKCRICKMLFNSLSERRAHELEKHFNHKTAMFKCLHCDREFLRVAKLESHIMQHLAHTKPFACNLCVKTFAEKSQLKNHMLSHSDARPYRCELCGRAFKTLSKVRIHLKTTHSSNRPLKCDKCDKAYKDTTDLRRHRWTHGGFEKKFECAICKKKFFELKLLRKHQQVHVKRNKIALTVS